MQQVLSILFSIIGIFVFFSVASQILTKIMVEPYQWWQFPLYMTLELTWTAVAIVSSAYILHYIWS
jgi:hypothetical protein